MKTKHTIAYTEQSGFVLLLTLVVVSIILAIGLSMLSITLKQLTLSNLARESEVALHAATSGIECMQYQRSIDSVYDQFTNADGGAAPAPAGILCANQAPNLIPTTDHDSLSGNANFYQYNYQYEVDGDKCVDTSIMFLDLVNSSSDRTHSISDQGLDSISCDSENVCTVIFSRGYNRPCDDLGGVFTVQRELTVQY